MLSPEVTPHIINCRPHQEAWKVRLHNSQLLSQLRDSEITQHVILNICHYLICRVYNYTTEKNVVVRPKQFTPTSFAITRHIKRSHIQLLV